MTFPPVCFMGKSLPSPTELRGFVRIAASSDRFQSPEYGLPTSKDRVSAPKTAKSPIVLRSKRNKMESSGSEVKRWPLSDVVSDCVKRWFRDALQEAKAGDITMQFLVGEMYYSGYGVPRDPHKGRAWISRASKNRASAWKVSDKRPGYNASDSDSDEVKEDAR